MRDGLLLLLGAVVGVMADRLWDRGNIALNAWRQRVYSWKFHRVEAHHVDAVLRTYRDASQNLFTTKTFRQNVTIPLLYDASLTATGTLPLTVDRFLTITNSSRVELPIKRKTIRTLRRSGTRLWDGNVLYLREAILSDDQEFVIESGVCNYYAYVSERDRVRSCFRRAKHVPRQFQTMRSLLTSGIQPISLAASALCTFETPQGIEVALQRRSDTVVSSAGAVSAIPAYGLESNQVGTARSRFGVLVYNFIKEFSEEFFGLDELVHTADSGRPHPDWILNHPQAVQLCDELVSGRTDLRVTGGFYDLRYGSFTYALHAHFSSQPFLEQLKLHCLPSWESHGESPAEKPIIFLALDDPEVDRHVEKGQVAASSLFALDKAREFLAARR